MSVTSKESKKGGNKVGNKKPFCVYCKEDGHWARGPDGKSICPVAIENKIKRDAANLLKYGEDCLTEEELFKRRVETLLEHGENYVDYRGEFNGKPSKKTVAAVHSVPDKDTFSEQDDAPKTGGRVGEPVDYLKAAKASMDVPKTPPLTFEEKEEIHWKKNYLIQMPEMYGEIGWPFVVQGREHDHHEAKVRRTPIVLNLYKKNLKEIYGDNWLNLCADTPHDCKVLREERVLESFKDPEKLFSVGAKFGMGAILD